MQFITLQEHNQKEEESFIFFLQYTNNEEAIEKLAHYIKKADTDDFYGDFSTFEIDTSVKLSQSTVEEMKNINFGVFGPMFTVCKGKFSFDESAFINLDRTQIAYELDKLYYACRITDHFSKNNKVMFIKKIDCEADYKKIMRAWSNNVGQNDIYHMILDWINTYKDFIEDIEVSVLLQDIKERMENNDETNDIVEDFINGSRYNKIKILMNYKFENKNEIDFFCHD